MRAGALPKYLRPLFAHGASGDQADGRLLERFASERDEEAFEILVVRHGPMVLRVCRAALTDPHDVDDAFQATFFVLARRASSVRSRDSIASWLYGVAARVAARTRVDAARRRKHERLAAERRASFDPTPRAEPTSILVDEVRNLPTRYREAIVLCYFEGQSCDAAAGQLGRPVNTVKSHLVRGRKLLQEKLVRRGVTAPLGLAVAGISSEAAASIPPSLLRATVTSASRYAAGVALPPALAVFLANGVLTSMLHNKIGYALLLLAVLSGGALALSRVQGTGERPTPPAAQPAEGPSSRDAAGNRQPASRRDDRPIPQDLAGMEKRRADLLKWNRDTLGGAYDRVGKRSPAWDEPARAALDLTARLFSLQIDPTIRWDDIARPAKAALDAGCDDPLVAYIFARTQPVSNDAEARRYMDAVHAFAASRYPAWRRAGGLRNLIPGELPRGAGGDAIRQEAQAAYDRALDLLPESVAGDERNEFWARAWQGICKDLVREYRQLGMAAPAAYEKVDARLARIPELQAFRLQFRGLFWMDYGWEARTNAFASNVPAAGFRTLEERLGVARSAYEASWKLQPGVSAVAESLVDIDKATGGDRAAMELWFERAMKADGDNRTACLTKLDWLDPKWHGTIEEMLAFGRQCRDTRNSRAGITLLLADAHWRVASKLGRNQNQYLARPDVWADIQSVYDEYLKHHPEDDIARSKYATLCYRGRHFREAEIQYVALGDRLTQWHEFPYVPLGQMKENREHSLKVFMGKDGSVGFPGWRFLAVNNDDSEWRVQAPVPLKKQEKAGLFGTKKSHAWSCSAGGITYTIRAQNLPDSRRNDAPGRVRDAARVELARESGAGSRNLRETLLSARPAEEYDVDSPDAQATRVKITALGNWLFVLSVSGTKGVIEGKDANEFFDSFAYQSKAGTSPATSKP